MPVLSAVLDFPTGGGPPPSTDRRHPDHVGHPAGLALGRRGARPTGSASFSALRAIALGLARVQEPVPVGEDTTNPRSALILATSFYEVWLITWPDGSGLASHGHGKARSVMHVVDGELIEIYSDHADEDRAGVRVLERGDSTSADPSFVHDLANRSGADATTLHVHSPGWTGVEFVEQPGMEELERIRSAVVAEQGRRVRSDRPPVRPPHLALVKD